MQPKGAAQISQRDNIVVVMGPTGAGKSTFIQHATGQNNHAVGRGWKSCTAEIQTVRATHPNNGHPFVFVDTPGFDDTYKSDTEILATIADWLVKVHKRKFNLAAILYLHRITDNRMSGTAMKNLRLFSSLCGKKVMPHVVVVTTMWSKVDREEAIRWEEILKEEVWRDMLGKGYSVERFEDTRESAWATIDRVVEKREAKTSLSHEIVDKHLRLNETQTGITLNAELQKLIAGQKTLARALERTDNPDGEQELAEIGKKISQTADQLRQLKIPFTRKVRRFFANN